MSKTILQVPVSKELKDKAEQAATRQGFSSLQESVRIFLAKLSQGNLKISFEPVVKLSPKAESRYEELSKDIGSGRNIEAVGSTKDLISKLNAT